MYTHIDDFLKAMRALDPTITNPIALGFKSSLGGKQYFEDLAKLKERFDLYRANQMVEDGSDNGVTTPKYNDVDLTIENLRGLVSMVDSLDGKFEEERGKTTSEVTSIIDEKTAKIIQDTTQKISEIDYTPLKNQVDLRYEQPDFVELLKRYNYYPNMLFKRVSSIKWEVTLYGDGRHLTYEFYKNTDDMLIQTKVTAGVYTNGKSPFKAFTSDLATYSGFVSAPTNGVAGYATTVGATFTIDVVVPEDNSDVTMNLYRRETGGLWEFQLGSLAPVQKSTFNATTVTDEHVLYTGVAKGTYTLKGTYKGQDPANPLEAPRGWIVKTNDKFIQVKCPTIIVSYDKVLTEPSNKEFAISFKPKGTTTQYFFPYHGTATAFNAEPSIFYNGQKPIDVTAMIDGQSTPITEFLLAQHVYARHPETGDDNIMEAWCNTRIKALTGQLSIDGKIKLLKEVTLSGSYVIMGTARGDVFDRLITSFGNQYVGPDTAYGTNYPMVPERDWVKSMAFISPVNKDYAVGFRYNNIKNTLRQGETGKDNSSASMTYLQNRDATLKKVYSRLFGSNIDKPAGYSFRFSGDYVFAVGKNLYDVLSTD